MRSVFRVLALMAVLLFATAALAQSEAESYAGKTIERIEVEGNATVAMDTIRVYLGLEQGDVFDPVDLAASFPLLWQTGLFDDIVVSLEDGEQGGVVVNVTVVERPRIGGVEYRGNRTIKTSDIVEKLDTENVDLHIGSTVDQIVVKRAAEMIEDLYAEAGHEGVTVNAEMEDLEFVGEKKIVFRIDEGIKARVAGIYFKGNQRFSQRKLRREMKEVKKHNLITWIRKKNVYTPGKFSEDLERLRNLYQDYGYQDIAFGDPIVETVGTRRPRVKVTVPISEGEKHQFHEVSVEGNTVFETKQIIGNWPLRQGETLSRRPIQDRVELFEELYRRRGYIYAFIDTEYNEIEPNVVDVKLNVYEGDQFRIGRIEFEGNSVTKDKVLRREIFLFEGDVMDMETFRASLFKIGQLGYFKLTDNPDFDVNPEEKTVDVLIKGKEEGKNDIQFGGGYSEAFGTFAQFQFSTRNFLGEGESVGLSFQTGRNQDFFSLSYGDPWFLDRPHSFGVSIFNRQQILPSTVGFETEGIGGTIAYGFRLGRFQSISFLYGFEDRKERTTYQPLPDREGNVPIAQVADSSFVTSAIVPTLRFDSRDNPFDTSRGMRYNLSLNYTGGPLGGTVNLIKPVATFSYYRPVSKRTTGSFNVEAGKIFPQSSADCASTFDELSVFSNVLCVPRSERFFVGGEQSIRGFRSYSLGPTELVNGIEQRVGGHSYGVVNLEWIYKINEPIRFVLFADAGQAFAHNDSFDIGEFRYSAGAEMRIFLPVFQFPLRFIWARNLDPLPTDRFESFQFSIGNTF